MEKLFSQRPKKRGMIGNLWAHQTKILKEYQSFNDSKKTDIALELPTGSGKTLIGLIISEWHLSQENKKTVYACPTKQLAEQVHNFADQQGFSSVLLTGSSRLWNPGDFNKYNRADSIAITTYSSIFNSNPKLNNVDVIIFDDAHTAENYVSSNWSISIDRNNEHEQFRDIITLLIEETDFRERILSDKRTESIRLVPPDLINKFLPELNGILSEFPQGSSNYYSWEQLEGHIVSCSFYISYDEILIRPFIPPTFSHEPFQSPKRRVYLSATLGNSGELQKSFGIFNIEKISSTADDINTGRRIIIFPELVNDFPREDSDSDSPSFANALRSISYDLEKNLLILTPSSAEAGHIANKLNIPKEEQLQPDTLSESIMENKRIPGVLLAANRYDGIDLADDRCRMMVVSGLPSTSHLQDKFLITKLRANKVLEERIKTKVIQGLGRCTRNSNDWSVIIVLGEDLLSFLTSPNIKEQFPIDLQAELELGITISENYDSGEILEFARVGLEFGEQWRDELEPHIRQVREDASIIIPDYSVELMQSAEFEVRTFQALWSKDFKIAIENAQKSIDLLTSGETRTYKSLWSYYINCWARILAQTEKTEKDIKLYSRLAEKELANAKTNSKGLTWIPEAESIGNEKSIAPSDLDKVAIANIYKLAKTKFGNYSKLKTTIEDLRSSIQKTTARDFERGLKIMGDLLGTESSEKPKENSRADAVWYWNGMLITCEAKSEKRIDNNVTDNDLRQAFHHLNFATSDLGIDSPKLVASLVIAPTNRATANSSTIAHADLYFFSIEDSIKLSYDICDFWNSIFHKITGFTELDEVTTHEIYVNMSRYNILPDQLFERTTKNPYVHP